MRGATWISTSPVRIPGRELDLCSLRRKPPIAQVVGERDPLRRPVVAIVVTLDELGEELLCLLPCGASGEPAVPLLAGDRVRALIDDGVVATALLGDMTTHGDDLPVKIPRCSTAR